ncbi:MAG: aminomethyl-transferring glycine dehydrogenase [Planctomycetota bacterium]
MPTRPDAARAATDPHPQLDRFPRRHHGQTDADLAAMLDTVGVGSLEALIEQTVPADIRLDRPMQLEGLDDAEPLSEAAALAKLKTLADQNTVKRSMIGMGYHGTITPPVLLRNVLEDPRWYTPYTPYQAEIAQGRLEALLNFQTMVSDLVGLPLAGASLLDEATAAAEAMAMCHGIARGKKPKFFVADDCHPQTIAVVKTRAEGLGIEVVIGTPLQDAAAVLEAEDVSGILLQYPNTYGAIEDYESLAAKAHEHGTLVVTATDLLACCLITPPGEWGADIAIGSAQRFGVPMGYGGPHAAFFATKNEYARKMPGRLIGVSKDAHGNPALRMAIQTREQHIKRDKATSNICTAQALLANMAGLYAVWHGPEGLKAIAQRVHLLTLALAEGLRRLGGEVTVGFDTVSVVPDSPAADRVYELARDAGFNLRLIDEHLRKHQAHGLCITLDETTTPEDLNRLLQCFVNDEAVGLNVSELPEKALEAIPNKLGRTSPFLQQPVFNRYHTEHEMLRYLRSLVDRDYGLAHGMIPLGSCTMKLNSAAEMIPVTWEKLGNLHPYAPAEDAKGYAELFKQLESWLAEITGFHAVSLQPNAGSQGEYAGLMSIRAYHRSRGDTQRVKCLIPTSAHGTNPASAVIAGMQVVAVKCQDNGDIDLDDLAAKAKQHADELAALMITYPSTHGVFEDTIRTACDIIHAHGGMVYMDGANMNAQVGLTSPGKIGADVCHLNLHKTFCIPHGGGGPGMGPIGVVEALAPFLPSEPCVMSDGRSLMSDPSHQTSDIKHQTFSVSAAPYGSPSILPISWMYIAMMGAAGLTEATKLAILNANYMAARLREHFDILYTGPSGTVAHEFIVDVRPFDKSAGVTVDDFAKRLMDYGFHAPTMSWPVAGTLMIEPTESESKAELDRFCDALIAIRHEIAKVEAGDWPRDDHPLKHAPHTAEAVTADAWDHAYSRQQAAFPMEGQRQPGAKFWPSVGRIDNPYGDRNLICTCTPMDQYAEA